MQLKEHKELQRAKLDQRHKYIISLVATRVDLENTAVEDFLLDGDQVDRLNDFLGADGPRAAMFFYQEAEMPLPGMASFLTHCSII